MNRYTYFYKIQPIHPTCTYFLLARAMFVPSCYYTIGITPVGVIFALKSITLIKFAIFFIIISLSLL